MEAFQDIVIVKLQWFENMCDYSPRQPQRCKHGDTSMQQIR